MLYLYKRDGAFIYVECDLNKGPDIERKGLKFGCMEGRFRHWCWQRKLRGVLRRNTVRRDPVGFARAFTIGIYYRYRTESEYESLCAFAKRLSTMNKRVRLFVYAEEKETLNLKSSGFSLAVVGRKDFDRCWFPHREMDLAVDEFLDTEYDLLLDFSPDFHYVDVSVMASCRARMKVGKYGDWNVKVNDLCLLPDGSEDNYVRGFIKVLELYLPLFDGNRD